MNKIFLKALLFLLAGYLVIVGLLTLFQNQLIFHPSGELWETPESLNMEWSEHRVETSDGVTLHGWMIGEPEGQPVVVFSHGNAGNISGRIEIAKTIAEQGSAVFLYDYRGYGNSEGSPSEEGIYEDGKSVTRYLRDELGISPVQMVFYGKSLGGAVAARQAAEFRGTGLVLDSVFTSGKDIATDIYPFIPGFLVAVDFPVDDDIRRTGAERILIMHARDDRIIPFRHGEKLYRIAVETAGGEQVTFTELRGGHNTGFSQSKNLYREAWSEFLNK
ncbi:MAG: alpha/beta hydrolase [Balneolaceae bacterium]